MRILSKFFVALFACILLAISSVSGYAQIVDQDTMDVTLTINPLQSCPAGLVIQNNRCVPIECPAGQQLQGTECIAIECPVGQTLNGSNCIPIECPIGQTLNGSNCEDIICPAGQVLQGDLCIITQTQLPRTGGAERAILSIFAVIIGIVSYIFVKRNKSHFKI